MRFQFWVGGLQSGMVCLSFQYKHLPHCSPELQVLAFRNFNNSLARQVHGQWIWWRNNQTHRRHEHVHASWACHVPLAALIIVLQDTLIPLMHNFLQGKQPMFQLYSWYTFLPSFSKKETEMKTYKLFELLSYYFLSSNENGFHTTQ